MSDSTLFDSLFHSKNFNRFMYFNSIQCLKKPSPSFFLMEYLEHVTLI